MSDMGTVIGKILKDAINAEEAARRETQNLKELLRQIVNVFGLQYDNVDNEIWMNYYGASSSGSWVEPYNENKHPGIYTMNQPVYNVLLAILKAVDDPSVEKD